MLRKMPHGTRQARLGAVLQSRLWRRRHSGTCTARRSPLLHDGAAPQNAAEDAMALPHRPAALMVRRSRYAGVVFVAIGEHLVHVPRPMELGSGCFDVSRPRAAQNRRIRASRWAAGSGRAPATSVRDNDNYVGITTSAPQPSLPRPLTHCGTIFVRRHPSRVPAEAGKYLEAGFVITS
jgi:hypothetical protein